MLKEKYYCKIPGCNNLARCCTTNGRFTKELCDEHYNKKFKRICTVCGKEFELLASTYINSLTYDWKCQTCHRISNARKFTGSEKQKEHLKKLNPGKILKDYYANPENKQAIKDKMLKYNRSDTMVEASKRNCEKYFKPYRESKEFKEYIEKHNSSKFCEKCNKITTHVGDRCFKCDPWDFNCEPNFTYKNNKLYYKDKDWEICKSQFKLQNIKTDFDKHNGFWQNTYRVNNIDSTGQDAMEQELVEKNIRWFVYIKFYKDKEDNIKPLVVGKSGSKLVNKAGSDISFSIKENDQRAARRFLIEENLDWFRKQIYVIPCKTEKDTLILEKEIQEKYDLFGG